MSLSTSHLWISGTPRHQVPRLSCAARRHMPGFWRNPGTTCRPVPSHRFFEIKKKLLDRPGLWITVAVRPVPQRSSSSSDAPAQKHRRTTPPASSFRKAGDTVTAAPTPCPCPGTPRVASVPLAARASTGPLDARCAADESRCVRPFGRRLTRARRRGDRSPITSAAAVCRACDQDHRELS